MMSIAVSFQHPAARAPAYLVGQDQDGHWLAVETHGLGGGFFTTREAALHYAREETGRRMDAITLAREPLALR